MLYAALLRDPLGAESLQRPPCAGCSSKAFRAARCAHGKRAHAGALGAVLPDAVGHRAAACSWRWRVPWYLDAVRSSTAWTTRASCSGTASSFTTTSTGWARACTPPRRAATFTYFIEQGGYAIFPWVALVPGALRGVSRLQAALAETRRTTLALHRGRSGSSFTLLPDGASGAPSSTTTSSRCFPALAILIGALHRPAVGGGHRRPRACADLRAAFFMPGGQGPGRATRRTSPISSSTTTTVRTPGAGHQADRPVHRPRCSGPEICWRSRCSACGGYLCFEAFRPGQEGAGLRAPWRWPGAWLGGGAAGARGARAAAACPRCCWWAWRVWSWSAVYAGRTRRSSGKRRAGRSCGSSAGRWWRVAWACLAGSARYRGRWRDPLADALSER